MCRCARQIKYLFYLQGAHGPFPLAQELDSEWPMPTVRMTWGCIIYSPGAKRFVSKPNHLPEFQISALESSVWFNKCLFSLTGIMATNHQRAGIEKEKFLFLFWDSRVALLYSSNLVLCLNCTSWLCMICMCVIRTVCLFNKIFITPYTIRDS